jgi:hypothetical protein
VGSKGQPAVGQLLVGNETFTVQVQDTGRLREFPEPSDHPPALQAPEHDRDSVSISELGGGGGSRRILNGKAPYPPEAVTHDSGFPTQLFRVLEMLEGATSAFPIPGARGVCPVRTTFDELKEPASGETGFVLEDFHPDPVLRRGPRNEDHAAIGKGSNAHTPCSEAFDQDGAVVSSHGDPYRRPE